ncbi:MAG TPA: right-handed parallel beta-helix repeat-containing protein [Sandaracinaceae bacterium LLY-WYZ-13_1]|nr:right-handed parallel beta-helix repeat-containing protein [Sandaracinaceae bacterium LLY-WYZ-13_1]
MRRFAPSLLSTWLLACGSGETRVDVTLHAEAGLASRARVLSLRVHDGDGHLALDEAVPLGPGGESMPLSVRLLPRTATRTDGFSLVARLRGDAGETLATVVARSSYLPGAPATLDLWFEDSCAHVTCGPGETCSDGTCVGGCFESVDDGSRRRAVPVPCLAVSDVYVDAERGRDDPEACVAPESPCASLRYALSSYVSPGTGTTVHLHGEQEHAGPIVLGPRHSGAAGTPTTLTPWAGTGTPVLRAGVAGPTLVTCCEDAGPHDLVVEGLDLPGGPAGAPVVDVAGGHDLTLRDLRVHEVVPPEAPPFVGAIQVRGGVTDVEVADARLVEVERGVVGIWIENASDVTVLNVDFAHPRGDLAVLALDARRVTLHGNRTEGGRGGFLLDGVNHRITQNRFCRERSAGVRLGPSRGVVIEHNSFARTLSGVSVDRRATDVTVRSNIFSRVGNRALELWRYEAPETESHNLFHDVGGFLPSSFEATEGLFDVDPRFVDVESCDLQLREDSPAHGRAHDGGTIGAD